MEKKELKHGKTLNAIYNSLKSMLAFNLTPCEVNVVYQFSEKRCRRNVPSRPLKRRLRRRLSGPRINVSPSPFFGKLKGKNWRGKRVEERMRKEHWTVTISLNIDFFFSSTIYISSSIREKNRVRVGEVFPSSIILKTGFFFISTLLFLLNRNGIQC